MSQRPMPTPRRPPAPRPEPGGWEWNFDASGLNEMLNAMLSRYQNMADINIAEAEASRPRNAQAFNEWLKKRQFEREMATKQFENVRSVQGEDRRRYDLARADIEKQQRDAENACAAMRAQGIPCASPSGPGTSYAGSSQGGVAAARPSMDYGRPVTPAFGPTAAYGGGGTTVVAPQTTVNSGGGGGGGGIAYSAPSSRIEIPDYWDTSAGGGTTFGECKDSQGRTVECPEGW